MQVTIDIINAFVDGDKGGNPAGVVLDADKFTQEQKLAIAKQVGLSETAFVSTSSSADFRLDFFTPTRQIAHCGHATIATFSHLAQVGRINFQSDRQARLTKETIDGNRKILIKNDMAYMEQLAPKYKGIENYTSAVLESLGLSKSQLIASPQLVNTGNSFIVLGVSSGQILSQLKVNMEKVDAISESLDLIGFYIFTTETSQSDRDAATRMFAPRYGITEEAATGMAAGPLACYLHDEMSINKAQINIEQGNFMQSPSPSVINVDLQIERQKIVSLMAGGVGKSTDRFTIEI